jgi:hypothetical protein
MPCTMALYTPDDGALLLHVTILEHNQHLQHDNSVAARQMQGQVATVLLRCCVYTHAGRPALRCEIDSAHLRHSGLNDLGHRRDRLLCYCWVCRCHDEKGGDAYNCTQAQP